MSNNLSIISNYDLITYNLKISRSKSIIKVDILKKYLSYNIITFYSNV